VCASTLIIGMIVRLASAKARDGGVMYSNEEA
jgi:hypothetical protein